jgi:hypothetical protein
LLIKGIILAMLALILVSLFSALVLLFRRADRDASGVAKAFTWRIGLSLALFVLLMAGLYFGIIPPEGLSRAPGR